MRSHIGWEEENETPFIRVWKPVPSQRFLKTLRESPKRTIYASGGPGPLQMVSEPDTGRCASEEAVSRRGVDTRWYASRDAGPERGVDLVGSHIDWRKERVPARTLAPKGGGL